MGRVGNALARELSDAFPVTDRYGRHTFPDAEVSSLSDSERLDSDIILITTNDDSIREVANLLVRRQKPPQIVVHTSGSLSSAVLSELSNLGCSVASMHPLVSVTGESAGRVFEGAYFCLEGDERAVFTASEIAKDLGGIPFVISTEKKAIYHAAAVTAAGHVVAIIDIADEMMRSSGVESEASLRMLEPLVASVIANVFSSGTTNALTGTYSRGDIETAKGHLASLGDEIDPRIREIFIDLALRSVEIARRNNIDESKARQLETLLSVAKERSEL